VRAITARRVVGAVLVVVGAVWIGQGLDVINGSFMTGSTVWAMIGALCVLGGLAAFGVPSRRTREQP
jgi:drug/metabolite transporter (DMT)-like permease